MADEQEKLLQLTLIIKAKLGDDVEFGDDFYLRILELLRIALDAETIALNSASLVLLGDSLEGSKTRIEWVSRGIEKGSKALVDWHPLSLKNE
tara:strand:- start:15661 stop:15939 length:279 start_codon:yes stop_codon:yes gene_type:complete